MCPVKRQKIVSLYVLRCVPSAEHVKHNETEKQLEKYRYE